ncbi:hypothetical protein [Martelella alba]|uniref:hypothetical protein n=1 Tax=Martelella alba TaxID=2590451 RepID=UPI001485B736|nr:hypothetical protein [Martelella alba]
MFNFAHLLGRAPSAAEDDEDNKQKSKKARKAEDDDRKDDDDPDASEDDDDGKDDDKKEGKTAKRADDDDDDDPDAADDDDDDKDEDKNVKKGRKAEKSRCAAIFASQHAAGRPALAASLAFNTSMSARAAIRVLASSAPEVSTGRRSLDARMQDVPNVKLGADGGSNGKSALVNRATSLYNQAVGNK